MRGKVLSAGSKVTRVSPPIIEPEADTREK
jgi:hypothetical protein